MSGPYIVCDENGMISAVSRLSSSNNALAATMIQTKIQKQTINHRPKNENVIHPIRHQHHQLPSSYNPQICLMRSALGYTWRYTITWHGYILISMGYNLLMQEDDTFQGRALMFRVCRIC